jgi:hypothetical protein
MPESEKWTLARWVDLGAPIELGTPWGFLEDDLRPTLVARPSVERAEATGSISAFEVSAFDVESGVAPGTLHVSCDQATGAFPPGSNLASGLILDSEGGVLSIPLASPLPFAAGATCTFRVEDAAGHRTEIVRTYAPAAPLCGLFCDGFELGSTALWE